MIKIQQEGKNIVYSFDPGWVHTTLPGDHFLADIADGLPPRQTGTSIYNDGIWTISSCEHDPDVLFYMWKRGTGSAVDIYMIESELLFLHQFYSKNGFNCLVDDVARAQKRYIRGCVLI